MACLHPILSPAATESAVVAVEPVERQADVAVDEMGVDIVERRHLFG